MNGTKHSFHGPCTHFDARDWQIIREWQPRSFKGFNDLYTSFDTMRDVYGWLPNTLFTMRDWEMSMQFDNLWNYPLETGVNHARDWIAWRDQGRFGQSAWKDIPNFDNNRTVVLGINEPSLYGHLNRNHPDFDRSVAAVNTYTVAFLDTLASAGMKGGALNLSVGFPDNTGQNTRANWELFTPVRDAIIRGGHYLILHEYFGLHGMQENKGWWVGRYRQCPWNLQPGKIIIGEGGFDKGVYAGWTAPRGWQGNLSDVQYIQYLRELDAYYKDDPRIHSVQLYTYDYGNNEWETFSIRALREQFLPYVNSVRNNPDTNQAIVYPSYPAGVINPLPPTGTNTPPPPPMNVTVQLSLPYVSQLTPPLDTDWGKGDCGLACMTSWIHALTPHRPTVDAVGIRLGLPQGYTELGILTVRQAGQVYGVNSSFQSRITKDQLIGWLAQKKSVLMLGHYKALPSRFDAFYDDGHYINITGYNHTTGMFRYDDPYWRTASDGEDKPITWDQLRVFGSTTTHFNTPLQCLVSTMAFPLAELPTPLRYDKLAWALERSAGVLQSEGYQREHDYILNSDFYQDIIDKREFS